MRQFDPEAPGSTPEQRAKMMALAGLTASRLEDLLTNCIDIRRELESRNRPYSREIVNVLEFVLLAKYELALLHRELSRNEQKLGPNYFGRVIVLTILESTKTLRQIMARDFQQAVEKRLTEDNANTMRKAHSEMCRLFNSIDKEFGDVRHGLIGHKDRSAEERLRLLLKADVRRVTDYLIEFENATMDIPSVLFPYISIMSKSY